MTGPTARRPHRARRWVAPAVALGAVLGAAGAACGDDDDPAADIDMEALRDTLDERARDTIATALYENPGSHDDLLSNVATDEPELWAEINADGEITLDEFRSVRRVANAVNSYAGQIVDSFEREALDQAGEG